MMTSAIPPAGALWACLAVPPAAADFIDRPYNVCNRT
jgi:hypothetical protein